MSFTSEFLLRVFPKLGDSAAAENALKRLVGDILQTPALDRVRIYDDFLKSLATRKKDQVRARKLLSSLESAILSSEEESRRTNLQRGVFDISEASPAVPSARIFSPTRQLRGGSPLEVLTRVEPGIPAVVPMRPDINAIIRNADISLRNLAGRKSGLPEEMQAELARFAIELRGPRIPDPETRPVFPSLMFQHAVPAPGARELIREGVRGRTVVMDLNTVVEILSSPTPGVEASRQPLVRAAIAKGQEAVRLTREPKENVIRFIEQEVELEVRQFMRREGPDALPLEPKDRAKIARILGDRKPDGTFIPGALERILDDSRTPLFLTRDEVRKFGELGIGKDNLKRILVEAGIPPGPLGRLSLPLENPPYEKRVEKRVEYVAHALDYLLNPRRVTTPIQAAFLHFDRLRDQLKLEKRFWFDPTPPVTTTIIPGTVGVVESVTNFLRRKVPGLRVRDIVKFTASAREADALRPPGFGTPLVDVHLRRGSQSQVNPEVISTPIFPLSNRAFGTSFVHNFSRGDLVQLNFKNKIVSRTFNPEESRSVFLVVDEVAGLSPVPRTSGVGGQKPKEFEHVVALVRLNPQTRRLELGSEVFLALPEKKTKANMPITPVGDRNVRTIDAAGREKLIPLRDLIPNPRDQASRFAGRLRASLASQSRIELDRGAALYEVYSAETDRMHYYTPDRSLAFDAMKDGRYIVRALPIGKRASFEEGVADLDVSFVGRLIEGSRRLAQRYLDDIILEGEGLKSNRDSVRNLVVSRWARDFVLSPSKFVRRSTIVTSRRFMEMLKKVSLVAPETPIRAPKGAEKNVSFETLDLDTIGHEADALFDNLLRSEGVGKAERIRRYIIERILSGDKSRPQIKIVEGKMVIDDPSVPPEVLELASNRALTQALNYFGRPEERRGLFRNGALRAMGEYAREVSRTRKFNTVLDEMTGFINKSFTPQARLVARRGLISERAATEAGAIDLTADVLARQWSRLEDRGYEFVGIDFEYEGDFPAIFFKATSPHSGDQVRIRANILESDIGQMLNLRNPVKFFERVEKELLSDPQFAGFCGPEDVGD